MFLKTSNLTALSLIYSLISLCLPFVVRYKYARVMWAREERKEGLQEVRIHYVRGWQNQRVMRDDNRVTIKVIPIRLWGE
jgi:hypothetical protein